jgi:hypothetical protein
MNNRSAKESFLTTMLLAGTKPTRSHPRSFGFRQLLAALLFLFPELGPAWVVAQEKEKEPLGSLTSIGEVYVNDSPAPSEITVFSGDRVRTGESGSATFNMSGKGALKLSPRSQVLFSGNTQYVGELEAGTAVMTSFSGSTGVTLRTGSVVVVPAIRGLPTSSKTDRAPDGSFLISCLDGSLGVMPLEGTPGQFLQVGQSVSVSSKGKLSPAEELASTTRKSILPPRAVTKSDSRWAYLGLAGAGAGAAAAVLSHGGGKQSVSPSSP